jgi:hypothetical protein
MQTLYTAIPKIEYDGRIIKDIFRRSIPTKNIDTRFNIYSYILEDGDTPEMLAHKLYNDVNKHWILLLINNVIDPHMDWLLSIDELERYTENKYGNLNDFHHWEDDEGDHVYDDRINDHDTYNLIYTSNIDHETHLNEIKRDVKIIPREYIADFEEMFKESIK